MTQSKKNLSLPSAEQLEQEAAAWIAKIDKYSDPDAREIDVDAFAERDEGFASWLQSSPSHRVALLRLTSVWQRTHRLRALRSSQRETIGLQPMQLKVKSLLSNKGIIGFAVAASIALAFILGNVALFDKAAPYKAFETVKGGLELVPLADGSKISLNSDTKLSAGITTTERIVILERGEAFFDIAPDDQKPFKIIAGTQVIKVIGTKFAVHRRPLGVEVIVEEGEVQVSTLNTPQDDVPTRLIAGDIAKTESKNGSLLVEKKDRLSLERELSWRQGYLSFDQTSLSDAAFEFNRYNKLELAINDPEVAAIQISGRFRADNVEAFVRLITEGSALRAHKSEEKITISDEN